MDCQRCREAFSARLDGEDAGDAGVQGRDLDAHLAACSACRAHADRVVLVTRLVRTRPVEDAPDLVERVMATAAVRLPLSFAPSCECLASCACGCQDGAPCRCRHAA